MLKSWIIIFGLATWLSCKPESKKVETNMTKYDEAPQWAKEAIWYQIFIERFSNGNALNNPDLVTCNGALFDNVPSDWTVTPWGHNWYQQEDWAKKTGLDFYRTIQMRRYGGDLQGVINKIPYLKDLGITAIYFNPINDAPSLHKYDARNYHHIDITLGNDKESDMKLIASEDKDDPSKWAWTSADKMFVDLINLLHESGIKVIMDFSWNHTGTQFWAFQDIMKNGTKSKYKNWFEINSLDNPDTKDTSEFDYNGWFGIKSLPELKKIKETEKIHGQSYEGNMPVEVKSHIFAVCKRWMDPNGDGNPNDGIDGMRLDVAEHVPLGFWRDFRSYVRSVNPEFYLVGENWWKQWPDELMDPMPWVKGDVFDAVMHYHWYRPARAYFNHGDDQISVNQLYGQLEYIYNDYRTSTAQAMMNLVSSHDSDRVLSALANTNKYKAQNKPPENKNYFTGQPNQETYEKLYALLLHQFTFVGAPHIWNGDEMGMWGADDPDNRKPMWWKEISFEEETPIFEDQKQYKDQPKFNDAVFNFYKRIINLRKQNKALALGTIKYRKDLPDLLAYERELDGKKLLVLINGDPHEKKVAISEATKELFNHKCRVANKIIKFAGYGGIVLEIQ